MNSRSNIEGDVYPYLPKANLTRATLPKANLSGAVLTETYLYQANLTGADLTGADLSEANLSGANLSWADLSGATNLTQTQIEHAMGNEGTRLPEDLHPPAMWSKDIEEQMRVL